LTATKQARELKGRGDHAMLAWVERDNVATELRRVVNQLHDKNR
jgi:hypothetical protein